jgi:hypothetical protein
MKPTPPPASPQAIRKGCTCCPDRNHDGKGEEVNGVPVFTYSADCVIHRNETLYDY